MSTAMIRFTFALAGLLLLSACASTSSIDVNRKAPERTYQVVNVVSGPEQAGDVSAALEAALQQRGFKIRVNPATQGIGTLTARYQDTWKRNGITYLNKLNVELLDVDTKTVLVSSSWKNTSGRQAQSVPEVVDQLVESMLRGMPRTRAEAPAQIVRADKFR
jgi:hypothetical protein